MSNILITGTSKGIGLTTALAFARKGHIVAATMRNPGAASVLSNIVEREKPGIKMYKMDVDSDVSVKECIEKVLSEIGPIDVLVNNAGIERMGTVEDLSLDDFRAVMETNYFGVIRCIHAVLPDMRKRRSGCIINITSIAGQIASPAMSAYSASKFALESLSEILAQEVKGFGIRVAIVEPGIINTSMAQHITVKPAESSYSHAERLSALFTSSLKRPVSPNIVADKIVEVAESENPALRHPVGPDAIPSLAWRRSMTDEEWVALGGLDDDTWYQRMEGDIGKELRIYTLTQG
jgi:NAD(P)-dependent dehydrogenase (short-subunit alcohol dehydrogenase family)